MQGLSTGWTFGGRSPLQRATPIITRFAGYGRSPTRTEALLLVRRSSCLVRRPPSPTRSNASEPIATPCGGSWSRRLRAGRNLGLAVLGTLALVACGGNSVSAGNITRKDFQPAHDNTWMMPIYTTTCSGNPTICSSHLVGMIPVTDHVPDHWYLALEDCKPADVGKKPKCERGTVKVTHEVFDRVEVGMHWDKS